MEPTEELNLSVLLPGGQEKTAVVHGSKPVMDVLVMLCAQHHLNPSDHTIELLSSNQNHIKFKPNSLIGSLEVESAVLKHKGADEKSKKSGPHVPEATVRLVINYRKSHKTVVRVNPRVPIDQLLPAICNKCEFDLETTVFFRDSQSGEALDPTKSLNDHGLRELFAKDMKVISAPEAAVTPVHRAGKESNVLPGKQKSEKEKENRGFFSLFRKKKPGKGVSNSAPGSPTHTNQHLLSPNSLSASVNSGTLPLDMPKKRRAPLPPMLASQSYPSNLDTSEPIFSSSEAASGQQPVLRRVSSTESSLKRTKRKAPPPPPPLQSISAPADAAPEESSDEEYSVPLVPLEEVLEEMELPLCPRSDHSKEILSIDRPCEASVKRTSEAESEEAALDDKTEELDHSLSTLTSVSTPIDSHVAPQPGFGSSASSRVLRNHGLHREGLTTFTVFPQQRESQRVLGVQLVLQYPENNQQCNSEHKHVPLCNGDQWDPDIKDPAFTGKHNGELTHSAAQIQGNNSLPRNSVAPPPIKPKPRLGPGFRTAQGHRVASGEEIFQQRDRPSERRHSHNPAEEESTKISNVQREEKERKGVEPESREMEEWFENEFPPPPSPVCWSEDEEEKFCDEKPERPAVPAPVETLPASANLKNLSSSASPPTAGLSLFALAVSQRSQLFTQAFNSRPSPTAHPLNTRRWGPGMRDGPVVMSLEGCKNEGSLLTANRPVTSSTSTEAETQPRLPSQKLCKDLEIQSGSIFFV
ncbi:uncharacterized protein cobll1a isoform X2 [Denticeps clupeoides]|uniref:Cordon-bleu ubiquitin-like domain-containing protein n=1 Tax=Denticeps clupeoides TaxID=299321 RepID=A0AAY4DUF5_9TELE|nr:uncharacterized protein LOC114791172 isoform X2 [Denticeps clupeoides]